MSQNNWIKDLAIFSTVLTEVLLFPGAAIALGYWLSKRYGGGSWVVPLFAILGLVLAILRLSRYWNKPKA